MYETHPSHSEGGLPTLVRNTARPSATQNHWSGEDESTDSTWVNHPTAVESDIGSTSSAPVSSSKSGKDETTVHADSSWSSPPAMSSGVSGSSTLTAVSNSKSGKEVGSVSWSESSPTTNSSKSEKDVGPSNELAPAVTGPDINSGKSGKYGNSESSLESYSETSDWSSPAVYGSKSDKVDSMSAGSSSKSGKEESYSGPSSAVESGDGSDWPPMTFDSKAEKVESSSATGDVSSWSASATHSSKSDKEVSSSLESISSTPGVSGSKSGKDNSLVSSSSSTSGGSKSSKEDTNVSTDASWASPPTASGSDAGSYWSPVVNSSKSGKDDSTAYADSSWVSPSTTDTSNSDNMPAGVSSKSSKTFGKSSKALVNGAVGPEFISNNRNIPVANDDFITTSQGESVALDLLSNDSVPTGKILEFTFRPMKPLACKNSMSISLNLFGVFGPCLRRLSR